MSKNEKLFSLLRKGVTYRKAIKVAGWKAANGRFTRIARAEGYRLVCKRLPDRDVAMKAVKSPAKGNKWLKAA